MGDLMKLEEQITRLEREYFLRTLAQFKPDANGMVRFPDRKLSASDTRFKEKD